MFLGRVVEVAMYGLLVRHLEVTSRDDGVVVQMKAFFLPAIAARYRYVYTRRIDSRRPPQSPSKESSNSPSVPQTLEKGAETDIQRGFVG